MTMLLIGVVLGVFIGVAVEKIGRRVAHERELIRQANSDHIDAMLTSSVHRAWAALEAGDKVIYGP